MEHDETKHIGAGPHGEAIGSKVDVPPGPLEPAIRETLRRIDQVHGIPGLPRVLVEWTNAVNPQGRYHPPVGGGTVRIEVSNLGDRPRATFLHEVGHLLDHFLGGFVHYASRDRGSLLAPVLDALRRTEAYARLNEAVRDTSTIDGWQSAYISGYLLGNEELWARAYTQYVVTRSDDALAREELDTVRREADFNRYRQWADEDFAPAAGAMDEALRKLGWKR